jgi:hypothetical protein
VGFGLNPVASFMGFYDGQLDNTPGDYQVQVDWGDGGGYSSQGVGLVASGSSILVKASHIYQTPNTYNVSVEVTGPQDTSAQRQTTQVVVSNLPDPASRPPDVPTTYPGAQPLGNLTLSMGGASTINSFTGVGFALNPVGMVEGFYDGQVDNTPGDYHAQINWGDSPTWDTNVGLAADGSTVLIKGSHIYQQQGTFYVTVYVTGPDGQTVSLTSTQVVVAPLPDPASRPPDVPAKYPGAQPLGDVTLSMGGASPINAQTGVALAGALVGIVSGFYNGQIDKTADDYQAQINWGDSPQWTGSGLLASTNANVISIFGSHTYNQLGTFDVTVYVTGPDGQTASLTTTEVSVSQSPTPTPTSPTPTPTSPTPTPTSPTPTSPTPTPTPPFTPSQLPRPFPGVPDATSATDAHSNRAIDKEFQRLLNGMVDQSNAALQAAAALGNFASLPPAQQQQLALSALEKGNAALQKLANEAQKDPSGTAGKLLNAIVQQMIQTVSDNNAAGTGGKILLSELAGAAAVSATKQLASAAGRRLTAKLVETADVPEPPELTAPTSPKSSPRSGTAPLEGGLQAVAEQEFAHQNEQILSSKVGLTDRGFDVASWKQGPNGPQLIITEVKNYKGKVPASAFTAIGYGKQGADAVNLARLRQNMAVVAQSIQNEVSDPGIRQALLDQLDGTSATQPFLRLVGSQAKGTVFNQALIDTIARDVSSVIRFQVEWPPLSL